jgi:Arc/MetJ-type ribon-helix-helix transcriptional regulator
MNNAKIEQLRKLARTLVSSGLAPSQSEAIRQAKDMLKMNDVKLPEDSPKKQAEPATLPRVDQLDGAPDDSMKDVMEEDADSVYNN